MESTYQDKLNLSRKDRKGNQNFLKSLKKKKGGNLDQEFHELHEEVFEEVDCLKCANCCKTTSPIFKMKDIERISKFLRIKPVKFIETYLHLDSDGDYVLNSSPCAFLNEDNTCMVYEVRPKACAEYPHTDRKKIHEILDLTQKNTLVCPAVAEIVKRMRERV